MATFKAEDIDVKSNLQNDTPRFDVWLQKNLEIIRELLLANGDFYFDIGAGEIEGHKGINTIGVGAVSTTVSTLWDGSGGNTMYTYSATADIDQLSSDNAGDTHEVTITGLDANFDAVSQTVILNGQTPVTLAIPLIRTHKMFNLSSTASLGVHYLWVAGGGSTGGVPNTATDIREVMTFHAVGIPHEVSLSSVYTIPDGKTGFVILGKTSATNNKAVELTLWARPFGGVFQLAHHVDFENSSYDYEFKVPQPLPPRTDLEVRAVIDTGTGEVTAVYDIVLKDIVT